MVPKTANEIQQIEFLVDQFSRFSSASASVSVATSSGKFGQRLIVYYFCKANESEGDTGEGVAFFASVRVFPCLKKDEEGELGAVFGDKSLGVGARPFISFLTLLPSTWLSPS